MPVETVIEAEVWAPHEISIWADRAFALVCEELELDADIYSAVLLACDDARIQQLNADFRGKPQPTNVLSWPSEDRAADVPGAPPRMPDPHAPMGSEWGDIALAYETCAREARVQSKPFEARVLHLLVHGFLHLLGFDHENDADAQRMEALEVKILATAGVPNPYEEDWQGNLLP